MGSNKKQVLAVSLATCTHKKLKNKERQKRTHGVVLFKI